MLFGTDNWKLKKYNLTLTIIFKKMEFITVSMLSRTFKTFSIDHRGLQADNPMLVQ